MSEFVGRTGSKRVYSYPEGPRNGALFTLARNFATGPKNSETVAADPGTELPWNAIDAGTSTWDAATTYETGDLVFFANIEYVSRVDGNINNQPDSSPVQWEASASVPITPRSTGVVLVTAVVVVGNDTGSPIQVATLIRQDGGTVTPPLAPGATVPANSQVSIPVTAELQGLNVGQTYYIGVLVSGQGATLIQDSSSIDVREVIPATG